MEDFLQDDVQFNFVQLFNSKQPMMPDFEHPQYNLDLGIGRDETGFFDAGGRAKERERGRVRESECESERRGWVGESARSRARETSLIRA